MEKRDLYDGNRHLLGKTIFAHEQNPLGTYILVVLIFIENLDGKLLIQKRSEKKGGLWAITGGHPKAGETSLEGIITEVKEELSLDISKENIKLLETRKEKDRIADIYYVKMNINIDEIICQEEELSDVKLVSKSEIENMIKENNFHKIHGKIFLEVKDKL